MSKSQETMPETCFSSCMGCKIVYIYKWIVSILQEDVKDSIVFDHNLELKESSIKFFWTQTKQALYYKRKM